MLTRAVLCLLWYWQMDSVLSEAAQDRDFARTTILSLAGFSFTAVAALSLMDAPNRPFFEAAVWFVLVSFLAFLGSLNLQAYKATRWQNQLAQSLLEVGTLALLLALVALISGSKVSTGLKDLVLYVASALWLFDHTTRLVIDYRYLSSLSDKKSKKTHP